jgi:hypothetical protein
VLTCRSFDVKHALRNHTFNPQTSTNILKEVLEWEPLSIEALKHPHLDVLLNDTNTVITNFHNKFCTFVTDAKDLIISIEALNETRQELIAEFEGTLVIDPKATTFKVHRGQYGVNDTVLNEPTLLNHALFRDKKKRDILAEFQRQLSAKTSIDRDVHAKYNSEVPFSEFGEYDSFYEDRLRDHFLPKLLDYIKSEALSNNKRRLSGNSATSGKSLRSTNYASSSRSTGSGGKKKGGSTPAISLGPYLQLKNKTDDVAKYIASDAEKVAGKTAKQLNIVVKKQENKKLLVKKICDILITEETLEAIFNAMADESDDAAARFKARTKTANSMLKQRVIASIIRNIPTVENAEEENQGDGGEENGGGDGGGGGGESDNDMDKEYVVEKVLSHRGTTKRNLSFEVKYKDYEKVEWNSYANLKRVDKLHEYLHANGMAKFVPADVDDDGEMSQTAALGKERARALTGKQIMDAKRTTINEEEIEDDFADIYGNNSEEDVDKGEDVMVDNADGENDEEEDEEEEEEEEEEDDDDDDVRGPNGQKIKRARYSKAQTGNVKRAKKNFSVDGK